MGSLIGSDRGPSDWRRSVLRRKPVSPSTQGADAGARPLERSIGLFRLVMLGVGATVGTGIFVILSAAVPEAGPAILVSFLLAAVTAGLTALCYAELASALPLSGSSYSYAYATLGELAAFLVGACLLLEYAVSASAIAVGWGQYLNEVFGALLGWTMPDSISQPPGRGGYVNLPAIVLIGLCTLLLLRGTAASTAINAFLVVLKLAVLAFFAVVALTAFEPANLTPFAPLGWAGIGTAASTIFFSYVGLDTISTASEEVRDPARTLPLGILLSLVIVTAIYLLVALAGIGAQPWTHFAGQDAGLAVILQKRHRDALAGPRPVDRGGGLHLLRDPGDDVWPDPHPLRHEPGRTAAEAVPARGPAQPEPERQHAGGGALRRLAGGARPPRRAR